jgi:uncharacterized protein
MHMDLVTACCVMLMGMAKGGLPMGPIALPLLVLWRHGEEDAARYAVAFMLPLLCCMDIVALLVYRRDVPWRRLSPLLAPAVLGIAVASVLFVAKEGALVAVSETGLKLTIGLIGLLFVLYRATQAFVVGLISVKAAHPSRMTSRLFGFMAGLTSTIAHAAGPILQMYLLPQRLSKRAFASSNAAFFFVVNAVKLLPFALLGRIDAKVVSDGVAYLPVIPVGVLLGYGIVHILPSRWYTAFIYVALFAASVSLIAKAL